MHGGVPVLALPPLSSQPECAGLLDNQREGEWSVSCNEFTLHHKMRKELASYCAIS